MHDHHDETHIGRNLGISSILNFAISIVEIIGGIISGSLALFSDAIHNLGDSASVLIAYIANRIGKKPSTPKRTFGYKRIEILTALFNAVFIIAITIYLFFEAYKRFQSPAEIQGKTMFIVATIGLLANVISVLLLHRNSRHNLNVKAAYLHLIGDTLSSIVVIGGGIVIYFYEVYWLDPVITIFIGIYIIKEAYQILKETIHILMQSTPYYLDLHEVKQELESIPSVYNIHHVHAWNLTDQQTHFECHIELCKDYHISEISTIEEKIKDILHNTYNIDHTTLQFEYNACGDKELIKNK